MDTITFDSYKASIKFYIQMLTWRKRFWIQIFRRISKYNSKTFKIEDISMLHKILKIQNFISKSYLQNMYRVNSNGLVVVDILVSNIIICAKCPIFAIKRYQNYGEYKREQIWP